MTSLVGTAARRVGSDDLQLNVEVWRSRDVQGPAFEGELREKLGEPFAQRSKAGMIVSDNYAELTSNKVLA